MRPRIAIIGSGISGLGSAWLSARHHDVTVFDAAGDLGGHHEGGVNRALAVGRAFAFYQHPRHGTAAPEAPHITSRSA